MEALLNTLDPLFSAIADPAFLVGPEGRTIRANHVALCTFSRLEKGASIQDLAKELRWESAEQSFFRCMEHGETVFHVLKNERGIARFELTCIPLSRPGRKPLAVLITVANVMGESMMDERYRILSRVYDSLTEGVVTLDLIGRITGLNRSAVDLLGMEEEAVKWKSVDEVFRFERTTVKRSFLKALKHHEKVTLNANLERPSGNRLPCSLSLAPLKESEDLFVGFVVTLKDRTDQIEMERHLIQTEKLNSLGRLVASFAHELNNPLTSVIGFAQLMMEGKQDGAYREEIGVIHSHALRCKRIVENLLAFARKRLPERKPMAINEVVRAAVDLMGYHLGKSRITVRMHLDDDLSLTECDATQIQQVLVNLIDNAHFELAHREGGGVITLTTSQDREGIRIQVADNGPGIPETHVDRIFEPFFTTKPPGEGTGLGLSLSQGIMADHGGSLTAMNLPKGGAAFTLTLPVHIGPDPEKETEPNHREGRERELEGARGKRLLVVDDEREVCSLLDDVFSAQGIEVETAFRGEEAFERLGEGDPFDLLLLDVRLPGVNGVDLKERILRRWPEYQNRILLMTGAALDAGGPELLFADEETVIPKPFDIDTLKSIITDALAEAGTPRPM